MIKFSILLILVAFVLLGVTLSPTLSPNNPTILNVMERILCAPDENIVQEVAPVARRVDSTSNAFVVDQSLLCKTSSGTTYDVTDKLFGIGMVGFLVFLLFGVLFLIIGIIRLASGGNKAQVVTTTQTAPYYPPQKPAAAPYTTSYPATPAASAPPFTTAPRPAPAASQQPYTSYSPTTGYSTTTAVGTKPPAPSEKFDFDAAATMMSIPKPPATPPPAAPAASDSAADDSALKGRLKQLRDAFDAGLISNEEYERSRADLLRDFTDVN